LQDRTLVTPLFWGFGSGLSPNSRTCLFIEQMPNIPGYHIKTVTIENMKSDLHNIWKDIQLQLDKEKKLNEAEKKKT